MKPTADSPLQKLGIEKVPPIVTTAVLLDAKTHLGKGKAMEPGALVTAADIDGDAEGAGAGPRGLQAGDVLYIYTGWGDNWKDPDSEKFYYTKGPGLAYDAAKLIEQKKVVLRRARQSVHRSGGRTACCRARPRRRRARRTACRSRSTTTIWSQAGIHADPERQSRRAGERQGLAVVHHDPAAARARRIGLAGAAGLDRPAITMT